MWLLKRKAERDWEILLLNKCFLITHSHTDRVAPATTILVWGGTRMYIYCSYCYCSLHCIVSCSDDEFFPMSWDPVYFHVLQYFPVHRWSKMHFTPVQLIESASQGYQHTSFLHSLFFAGNLYFHFLQVIFFGFRVEYLFFFPTNSIGCPEIDLLFLVI